MNIRSIGIAMFKNKRMVKGQVEWISLAKYILCFLLLIF